MKFHNRSSLTVQSNAFSPGPDAGECVLAGRSFARSMYVAPRQLGTLPRLSRRKSGATGAPLCSSARSDQQKYLSQTCFGAAHLAYTSSADPVGLRSLDVTILQAFAKGLTHSRPNLRVIWQYINAARSKPAPGPASIAADGTSKPEVANHYSTPAEYSRTATATDIFQCFRLLLGRHPNPEEWPGHSSRVGEDLENVVRSFLTSREFAARGLLDETYRAAVEVTNLPGFSLIVSKEDLATGHHVLHGHPFDPGVAAVLRRYVKPGMSVVDIGANIGCLTMLLASLVGPTGRVLAVEPNPENVKLLEASRRLNGFDQVIVLPVAAGRDTGVLALNVSFSNGMTGELPGNVAGVLGSRPVPSFALDLVLPQDRSFDVVKLDAEGAEFNALIGMTSTIDRDRPVIVSEFSPTTMPGISHCSGPDYLGFLIAKGYQLGVVERDGSERVFGDDIAGVMTAYSRSGIDHIDILARPMTVRGGSRGVL